MAHTDEEWRALFKRVHDLVAPRLGATSIIVATLVASPSENLLAECYSYMIRCELDGTVDDGVGEDDLNEDDKEARKREPGIQKTSLMIREVLLKLITLIGAPRVLCALIPFASVEGDVKRKAVNSQLDKRWAKSDNLDPDVLYQNGMRTMNAIYGSSLLPKVFESFGSHKEDISFHEIFAIYGIYLSDYTVLDPIKTEAVVYAAISSLGLGGPGNWHLRGMGRMLGAHDQDTQSDEAKQIIIELMNLREAVMEIIRFVGNDYVARARLDKWATVDSMVREFGGWGEKVDLGRI